MKQVNVRNVHFSRIHPKMHANGDRAERREVLAQVTYVVPSGAIIDIEYKYNSMRGETEGVAHAISYHQLKLNHLNLLNDRNLLFQHHRNLLSISK